MKPLIPLLTLLFLAAPLHADSDVFKGPVSVQQGFLSGEDFLKLSESDKAAYSMGIIDGYLSATIFGADAKYLSWISNCIKGKTNTQISAMLVKYLQDNPGRWEKSVQFLMFEALTQGCGR